MGFAELPIIPRSGDWKHALQGAIRDPRELLRQLQLPLSLLDDAEAASRLFPLRVPHSYLSRMEVGNCDDPLLRQVLPVGDELHHHHGFGHDPVGDLAASQVPGLLQKYHGRVLLIATAACAINCRFCFRRHFPYREENPAGDQWQSALDAIEGDPAIDEVILSGGDPLLLDDQRLAELIGRLEAIPHLKRLRLHTRLPVVLPERITPALIDALSTRRLDRIVVLHTNHPNEIDETVAAATATLRAANIHLLNQSVLLRGVNDDVDCLATLSKRLFAIGVLPYYLHLLDRVAGAAHFESDGGHIDRLVERLRCHLPGYLVPRVVREEAGADYKLPL